MPTDWTEASDDVLVASVLAGQDAAFAALVTRYQGPLLRLARNFVRDTSLAEDVVQDTWIGLLRGVEKFEGRSTFKTWLFRVLANRARSRAVREARYVPLDQDHDDGPLADRFDAGGTWRMPPPGVADHARTDPPLRRGARAGRGGPRGTAGRTAGGR